MMANADNPRGAYPAGAVLTMRWYPKTAAAIFPGDLVVADANGLVSSATAGGIELLGVAVTYEPAADAEVLVYDDPDQQYYMQDDASWTAAEARIGECADIL